MNKYGYAFVLMAFLFSVSACINKDKTSGEALSTIKIGVLPDESPEQLRQRYMPLVNYISKETGVAAELIIPETYRELVKRFETGEVDLAYFGGFTFVKVHLLHGAVPIAMRDTDVRFTTYFLVRKENIAKSVSEFEGKRFSFGSELSTSGHLMPRYFLIKWKIKPEEFFGEVLYSGAHDKTAYWVRDGKVDIGAANATIISKMFSDGRLKNDEIRVLAETPPYPDYVWALRGKIEKGMRMKIKEAFLKLSTDNPDHMQILNGVDANHFLPASPDDFSELAHIVKEMNFLDK